MQTCVLQLFTLHGLTNSRLGDAALSGLTADPIQRVFRSAVVEARKPDGMSAADEKILANVCKRIRTLTETRNNVLHRTWFVGWFGEEESDQSTVHGWKFENTAKGAEFRPLQYAVTDFDDLSNQARLLANCVRRIAGCLLIGTTFEKNFTFDGDGNALSPDSKMTAI